MKLASQLMDEKILTCCPWKLKNEKMMTFGTAAEATKHWISLRFDLSGKDS